MIDLARLKVFVSIIDAGGFTPAARKLNVAQPWLSVQLRQLENALGFNLVKRGGRSAIELTREGAILLPLAHTLLANASEFESRARQIARLGSNGLTIGTNQISLYMPERNRLVQEFIRLHPKVALRIESGSSAALYERLMRGDIDVAIANEPAPAGLDAVPLCAYRSALLIPNESPFARQAAVALHALRGCHVLTLSNDFNPLAEERRSALAKAGVVLHDSPETSYEGLVRQAQLTRQMATTVDLPDSYHHVPADMTVKVLEPAVFVQWNLVRRPGSSSRNIQRIWDIGRALGQDPAS